MIQQRWTIALLVAACLPLAACEKKAEKTADDEHEEKPAVVEHLEGPQPTRVKLTEKAAKRIDVQTAPVADGQLAGQKGKVIPYAAVLYDLNGETWTWINTAPLTFVRTPIKIERIDGDKALLAKGPDPGALVVTTGAQELFGSESEFEEE